MNDDDPIVSALRALPKHEPSAAVSARIKRRGRAAIASPTFAELVRRTWGRAIVPVLVTGFAAGYLAWAFEVATSIGS